MFVNCVTRKEKTEAEDFFNINKRQRFVTSEMRSQVQKEINKSQYNLSELRKELIRDKTIKITNYIEVIEAYDSYHIIGVFNNKRAKTPYKQVVYYIKYE